MSKKSSQKKDKAYKLPKVWKNETNNGGKFASVNQPTAGARSKQKLPRGKKPLQLYSLNTPNGVKINIMLEELAELKVKGAGYDAFKINIMEGEQFGSDFVDINPNSKIPALVDQSKKPAIKLFESGAILMYLAEKHKKFIPTRQGKNRAECLSWLMWQMASAPYVGGGFGHFYAYAPEPMEYPINRFTMETKRQLDLLDKHLAKRDYICKFGYSVADIAIWPWYGRLILGEIYPDAEVFLNAKKEYPNLMRWAKKIAKRKAVKEAVKLELKPIKK